MRFGFFIPQGWRMDLVGIEREKHWAVMRDLATYADDASARDSLCSDHYTASRCPATKPRTRHGR